jgi:hypothetical protein
MQRLKRLLRAVILFARYVPATGAFPEWSEHDAKELSVFFNTDAGKKIERMMSLYSVEVALDACGKPEHQAYRCGAAFGARAAFAYLESHKFRQSETHSDDEAEDESGILSRFST